MKHVLKGTRCRTRFIARLFPSCFINLRSSLPLMSCSQSVCMLRRVMIVKGMMPWGWWWRK